MESNDDYPKIIPRINRSQSLLDHSSTPNLENNGIPIEPLVRRNHTLSNSGGRNRTERKVTLENSLVSEEQSFTPQQHSVVEKTISSFVVMRGAKGADELSPRISNPYFISSGPPLSVSPPRLKAFIINPEESSAVRPVLESRNSLAFLESGAENTEEDWERRILETRQVENNKGDQFPARRPSPTTATSFQGRSHTYSSNSGSTLGHSRSQTERHTESPNSWNDSPETLRRRQSLNFRIQENSTQSITTADRFESEKLLASGLSFNNVNSSFSRTRSGTGPPGLTLSLSHNNHNRTNQTLLSHSNSLNSHSSSLSHSNSLSTPSLSTPHSLGGGALSPVGVFPRSPWSPTVEEANQLGMGSGVPASSLTRGESGSSRGSGSSSRIAVRVVERKDSDEIDSPVSAEGDGTDAGIATGGNFGSIQFNRDEPRRSLTLGKAPPSSRRLPPLMTNSEILSSLATPSTTSTSMAATQEELVSSFLARQGPASAAAYVPPIGHSHFTGGNIASSDQYSQVTGNGTLHSIAEPNRNFTAAPGVGATDWIRQKESIIGYTPSTTSYQSTSSSLPSSNGFPSLPGQNSNPTAATNAGESWPAGGGFGVGLVIRQQEQIQILQNQMHLAMQQLALNSSLNSPIPGPAAGSNVGMNGIGNGLEREVSELETEQGILPIDIQALIATKGYNPTNFNVMPQGARFFVIKSYTEEDVHKSLKHEIWASTDLGNKRLDRAFRESSEKGPLYLFFSVNASGHFAGMAQMLSSVDYATSSNVWASDKWKGILKVRWIYIKDVPLASLRHIRLSNTPENKPVTSSRDTQEVPYEAGCEVLRILSSFQSRTSLLQDFAYYEAGATSPSQTSHYQQTTSRHSIPPQQHSQQQQHHQQANYPSHPNYPQQQQQHYYGFQATAQVPVGVDGNRRYFNNGNNEQYYHQQAF